MLRLTIDRDDPPYYLPCAGSSDSSISQEIPKLHPKIVVPQFPRDRDDSENEDLRDVIDDLTIENKKLKRRLRQFEKYQTPDLQQDKLFEVLQSSTQSSAMLATPSMNASKSKRTSSSLDQQADSGYASMSSLESACNAANTKASPFAPSGRTKENNIRSYLYNIPTSSLPRKSPVLSEKAKMRLVVRKLENLFTGKQAASGEHSQSIQQQEVSDSAARADRKASSLPNYQVAPEGSREAHIMPIEEANNLEPARRTELDANPPPGGEDASSRENETNPGDGDSTSQRPTRPMDLDIQRAQIPAENIQYLRHLGLPSPQIHSAPETSEKKDGWIYVNLLISMAQLHTLNVTPDFIKKSISDLSSKFELSEDGSKMRWKGGTDATRLSSDSGSMQGSSGSSPDQTGLQTDSSLRISDEPHALWREQSGDSSEVPHGLPFAAPNPQVATSATRGATERTTATPQILKSSSKFDYQPVRFLRQHSSQQDDYLDTESDYADWTTGVEGTTARESGSNDISASGSNSWAKLADSGPIIFYNNPLFCTDLSGDRQITITPNSGPPRRTLGVLPPIEERGGAARNCHVSYFNTSDAETSPDEFRNVYATTGLDLSPLSLAGEENTPPMDMEVSGIGGVQPTDNFAVRVRYTRTPKVQPSKQGAYDYEIMSRERTELPESALPPPSYLWRNISSSLDEADDVMESDSEVEESSEDLGNDDQPVPPSSLKHSSTEAKGSDELEDVSSDVSMMDGENSIIHGLAPEPPQAVVLPAGSSVATYGGEVGSPSWGGSTSHALKRRREGDDGIGSPSKTARLTPA